MFCTHCGSENGDNSMFCTNCGAQLKQPIPNPPPAEPITDEIAATIAADAPVQPSDSGSASAAVNVSEPVCAATPAVDPEPVAPSQPVYTPAPAPAAYESTQPVPPVPPASPVQPIQPAYAPIPTPVSSPAAPVSTVPAQSVKETEETKPVSTGLYVLMQLLMLLPVVGLVVHVICLVAAKQRSFKNYCRAVVILGIIGLLLVIAGVIVGYVMLDSVNEFLADFNIRIEPLF